MSGGDVYFVSMKGADHSAIYGNLDYVADYVRGYGLEHNVQDVICCEFGGRWREAGADLWHAIEEAEQNSRDEDEHADYLRSPYLTGRI